MFVSIRFAFPLYDKVDDVIGQIDKIRKAESFFGIQELFWVRKSFLLSGIGCEKMCGIINDYNSLTRVEEAKKFVVSLKLALIEVRYPI